eukprot:GHVL01001650.1.p1 GENE.GHVL01001650.1~~GHVL01001650.1.p1  ORF type:complete len:136 (+),score=21.75 GHVL01001650.1:55-408(+)
MISRIVKNHKLYKYIICRNYTPVYWPPEDRSPSIKVKDGEGFVFVAKRDQDGARTPVLCFVDERKVKRMTLDLEEIEEFEKLVPRLRSYFELYAQKANERLLELEMDKARLTDQNLT